MAVLCRHCPLLLARYCSHCCKTSFVVDPGRTHTLQSAIQTQHDTTLPCTPIGDHDPPIYITQAHSVVRSPFERRASSGDTVPDFPEKEFPRFEVRVEGAARKEVFWLVGEI